MAGEMYAVTGEALTDIANAIRSKTGDSAKLSLGEMADSIEGLECGDDTETIAKLNAVIGRSIVEIRSDANEIGSNAFRGCSQLTTADFPMATSIDSYAFYNCLKLATIDFPMATSIGDNAFNGCSQLTTIDFPVATSISRGAFYNCSQLTTADFPMATSTGEIAFYGCSKLATIDFPMATSISRSAFNGCSQLTTADFPVATSIGESAFYSCSKLNALALRSQSLCSLSNSNAFTSTPIYSGAGYIYVPSSLLDSYKSATNWSTYATQFRALEDYTVDGTITGELDADKIGA